MRKCFQERAYVGLGAVLILCLMLITAPGQRKLGKRMNDAAVPIDLLNHREEIPAGFTYSGWESGNNTSRALVVVKVSMRDMQFSPQTLNIKKGTVVEWTNDDLVPHTATSASFDSGSLGRGKSWRHTFTKVGQFPYACTFHPLMKGVIVVK